MQPVLFHLGPISVRGFGFMVFVAFVMGLWYSVRQARRRMSGRSPDEPGVITPEHVSQMSIGALWLGILGARLVFVALHAGEYARRPQDILKIWEGGMTTYGAIGFGLLWLWFYSRRKGLSFLEFADLMAPAIALVYGICRIGCFLNGCCYGGPTDLPWGVQFVRDGHAHLGMTPPSHPAQLYASAMNFAGFALLHIWSLRPHRRGEIILGYLAFYSVYRFVYEGVRAGASSEVALSGLTHAQLFSLACLPIVLLALWQLRRDHTPSAPCALDPAP